MDCFPLESVLALLAAARKESEQDWLLILVAFLHALRPSEAVGLTRDNIVGDYLIVQRLKHSKRTKQPLIEHPNPLLNEREALIGLARKPNGNQRLFPISARTFQRRMHEYGELAGLDETLCHPHTLRHSMLSQMAQTARIYEVQNYAGHKSLASTGAYLHPKDEEVAAAARKALE